VLRIFSVAMTDRTEPWFWVRQRVVCVDAAPNPGGYPRKLLTRGRIYVIRAIDTTPGWKPPRWGVHLEGIFIVCPDGRREWAIHPRRFRPVVERPTDIEIFRELLDAPRERELKD
jgi:hypothetical protein